MYGNSKNNSLCHVFFFFFQAEDGIRDLTVTGVQTCALPIYGPSGHRLRRRGADATPRRPGRDPEPARRHRLRLRLADLRTRRLRLRRRPPRRFPCGVGHRRGPLGRPRRRRLPHRRVGSPGPGPPHRPTVGGGVTVDCVIPNDLPTPETYTHVTIATGTRLVFVAG